MPVEYSDVKTVIMSEAKGPKKERKNLETAEKTGIPQKANEVVSVDQHPQLVSDWPLKRTVFRCAR